jgi:hypothetical protein
MASSIRVLELRLNRITASGLEYGGMAGKVPWDRSGTAAYTIVKLATSDA